MKKTVCSLLMAGGLIGTEAHAAVTAPASLPNRVAAVRAEINKRVAEGRDLGGLEAVTKLPYASGSGIVAELGELVQLEQLAQLE